jgi:ABC-2 type transport system permease protein
MPIHDQGYRRYAGTRSAIGSAWRVMSRAGIMNVLRKRSFIALMLVAWIPFVIQAVRIYLSSNFQQASFLEPKGQTYREFLDQQGFMLFMVTVYVGAGLIAADRRANAMQLYLSKPMTRAEYIAGKMAILFSFVACVTFVPAMLLLTLHTIFAGNFTFIRNNLYLFPSITLFSLCQILLASTTMLALSSLSKSSRFVGVMFAGLYLFTTALFQALRGITGHSTYAWLAPSATLEIVGDVIFRLPSRYEMSPWIAVLTMVVLVGGSLFILDRKVRGVEIVT